MPIASEGTYGEQNSVTYGVSLNHLNGTTVNMSLSAWMSEADGDEAIQDLIDYINLWDKRDPNVSVSAYRERRYQYAITETEPDPEP